MNYLIGCVVCLLLWDVVVWLWLFARKCREWRLYHEKLTGAMAILTADGSLKAPLNSMIGSSLGEKLDRGLTRGIFPIQAVVSRLRESYAEQNRKAEEAKWPKKPDV